MNITTNYDYDFSSNENWLWNQFLLFELPFILFHASSLAFAYLMAHLGSKFISSQVA